MSISRKSVYKKKKINLGYKEKIQVIWRNQVYFSSSNVSRILRESLFFRSQVSFTAAVIVLHLLPVRIIFWSMVFSETIPILWQSCDSLICTWTELIWSARQLKLLHISKTLFCNTSGSGSKKCSCSKKIKIQSKKISQKNCEMQHLFYGY